MKKMKVITLENWISYKWIIDLSTTFRIPEIVRNNVVITQIGIKRNFMIVSNLKQSIFVNVISSVYRESFWFCRNVRNC